MYTCRFMPHAGVCTGEFPRQAQGLGSKASGSSDPRVVNSHGCTTTRFSYNTCAIRRVHSLLPLPQSHDPLLLIHSAPRDQNTSDSPSFFSHGAFRRSILRPHQLLNPTIPSRVRPREHRESLLPRLESTSRISRSRGSALHTNCPSLRAGFSDTGWSCTR